MFPQPSNKQEHWKGFPKDSFCSNNTGFITNIILNFNLFARKASYITVHSQFICSLSHPDRELFLMSQTCSQVTRQADGMFHESVGFMLYSHLFKELQENLLKGKVCSTKETLKLIGQNFCQSHAKQNSLVFLSAAMLCNRFFPPSLSSSLVFEPLPVCTDN